MYGGLHSEIPWRCSLSPLLSGLFLFFILLSLPHSILIPRPAVSLSGPVLGKQVSLADSPGPGLHQLLPEGEVLFFSGPSAALLLLLMESRAYGWR